MPQAITPVDFGNGPDHHQFGKSDIGHDPAFHKLYEIFKVVGKSAEATNSFLRSTEGHGDTRSMTGPEGTKTAREIYAKTFGAL